MKAEYLFSSGRWVILSFNYHPETVAWVKRFYPALFELKSKSWKIPFNVENYLKVKEKFEVSTELQQQYLLEKKKEEFYSQKTETDFSIPGFDKLWNYQRKAVEFIQLNNGRAILAADTGTGKTVMALAYLALEKPRTTLIVCPSSIKFNWRKEIYRWLDQFSTVVKSQSDKSIREANSKLKNGGIVICNYEAIKKLTIKRLDLLILDEFTAIKNHSAIRTKVIMKLSKTAEQVIGLSGTPMPNRPAELFTILKMIDGANWFSFVDYAKKYCGGHYKFFGPKKVFFSSGASNLNILNEKIKYYMLKIPKEKVLPDLPPIRRDSLELELESYDDYKISENELINELKNKKDSIEGMISDLKSDENMSLLVKINALQQLNAYLKVPAVVEWVNDFVDSTEDSLLIFAQHLDVIKRLYEILQQIVPTEAMTGETKEADREQIVARFMEGQTKVLIMSKVGTLGLNLTKASTALFMERDWTPANEEQAEARVFRYGQTNPVMIWYAHTPGTIDEHFAKIIETKKKNVTKITSQNQFYGLVAKSLIGRE